jgi:hypothetical protein
LRYNRSMKCTLLFALSAGLTLAQAPLSFINEVKQDYTSVKNTLLRSAEKMPEEFYSYKPSADVRDFGAEVAHAADIQTVLCSMALGNQKQGTAATKKTKADLIAALVESNALCDQAYATLTEANASQARPFFRGDRTLIGLLAFNNSHDNETYGTMVPYMRAKGIVPPTSDNANTKGKAK